MKHYRRGQTPKLYTTCREETHNSDGSLSDGDLANAATSMKVIIETYPDGEIVQALGDATPSATGLYYYTGYTIAASAQTGIYKYAFRAVDGSTKGADAEGYFEVDKEIA